MSQPEKEKKTKTHPGWLVIFVVVLMTREWITAQVKYVVTIKQRDWNIADGTDRFMKLLNIQREILLLPTSPDPSNAL